MKKWLNFFVKPITRKQIKGEVEENTSVDKSNEVPKEILENDNTEDNINKEYNENSSHKKSTLSIKSSSNEETTAEINTEHNTKIKIRKNRKRKLITRTRKNKKRKHH